MKLFCFSLWLIALGASNLACSVEQAVSQLQEDPGGFSVANYLSPSEGDPKVTHNHLIVRTGFDRGMDGFRASGPQYVVPAGSQTGYIKHDFNKYPHLNFQTADGAQLGYGQGGIEGRDRRDPDGTLRSYDFMVGRDPKAPLRQLRQEEPIRHDPNLISTPHVAGYYREDPKVPSNQIEGPL